MALKFDTVNYTEGEISISNFEWKINVDKILSSMKNDEIISPSFSSYKSKEKINSWYLSLTPEGDQSSTPGYMALFLNNSSSYKVTVSYTLSLMNNNCEKINTVVIENHTMDRGLGFGVPNFVLKTLLLNPINNLIKYNKITVVCTIYKESYALKQNINQYSIYQQMNENIFNNKKYSDVTIIAADRVEFFLHKCILAAQSNVFEAMFDTDMLEKTKNFVKIDDFDSLVLNEFFQYLYTGKMDQIRARDLLFVAEKYNVVKLKDLCEDIMSKDVNIEKAVDYFLVAEMNNAKKLRINMIQYMAFNLKELKNKPEIESITTKQLLEIVGCHFELSVK